MGSGLSEGIPVDIGSSSDVRRSSSCRGEVGTVHTGHSCKLLNYELKWMFRELGDWKVGVGFWR